MTSLVSAGGALFPPGEALALDRNGLQSGQQASWDREAFDSLFEQQLRSASATSRRTAGTAFALPASSGFVGQGLDPHAISTASAQMSSLYFVAERSPRINGSTLAHAAADPNPDAVGVATIGNEPPMVIEGAEGDSDALAATTLSSIPFPEFGGADLDPLSVVVQVQDSQVLATVRLSASTGTDADAHRLVDVLRSELSWRGLTLGSLTLNGKEVWKQTSAGPLTSAAATSGDRVESLENSYGS